MMDIILELPIEFWNIDTQVSTAGRYINHPVNLPTIKLTDEKKLFSTSSTGIPSIPLLDHNGTSFSRTPGTSLEHF